MITERWAIVGFMPHYQVSDLGRLRNTRTGKYLSGTRMRKGYIQAMLCDNGQYKMKLMHRLVADAFLGERKGREVNHINGIKSDNRLSNLEWVTASENAIHKYQVLKSRHPSTRQVSTTNHIGQRVIFPSLNAASAFTGVGYTSISACCRGVQKTAGGMKWDYA